MQQILTLKPNPNTQDRELPNRNILVFGIPNYFFALKLMIRQQVV